MKIIKTYYLIDYENVGSEGFKGCGKLRETDIIHLFYTDNSRKIDLDIINDHGESKLVTHKVPTGNQSADMHLGSYLGYLIGKECIGQDGECKIVVISKDTGFDHIIEFWKTEKQLDEQPEKQSAKQSEKQNTKKPKQKIIDMNAGTKKLQQELVLVLDKAGMPKEVVNHVSTTVAKNAEDKNRKQQIYRSIISKYGQTKGLNIYNHIKKKI